MNRTAPSTVGFLTRLAAVSCVSLLTTVLTSCGGDEPSVSAPDVDPPPPAASGPTIDADGLSVERTWVGPEGVVHHVTADGDRVLALASTRGDGAADLMLRSEDGGLTWSEGPGFAPTPMGEPSIDWTIAPVTPMLHRVGDGVVVATRSRGASAASEPRLAHDVMVSSDGGESWLPVELPVPSGATATVAAAVSHGGRLVLVGAVESPPADGDTTDPLVDDLEHFDAAFWFSDDDGATFQSVIEEGVPGFQAVRDVISAGDRLVALVVDSTLYGGEQSGFPTVRGRVSVSDDGASWTATEGFPPHHFERSLDTWIIREGAVHIDSRDGRVTLDPDSTEWQGSRLDPPASYGPDGILPLDGDVTLEIFNSTGTDSAAQVRRSDQPTDEVHYLEFEGCEPALEQQTAMTTTPAFAGEAIAAVAWCEHRGFQAPSVAWSLDDGFEWETARLSALAPEGFDDLALGYGDHASAAISDGLILLGSAVDTADRTPDRTASEADRVGPITAIRITAQP